MEKGDLVEGKRDGFQIPRISRDKRSVAERRNVRSSSVQIDTRLDESRDTTFTRFYGAME